MTLAVGTVTLKQEWAPVILGVRDCHVKGARMLVVFLQ